MTGSFDKSHHANQASARTLDPALIAELAGRFQDVPASPWQPNTFDWHATHEEQFRSLVLTGNDPRLPELSVNAVQKRLHIGQVVDIGGEYRFTFEKTEDDKIYQIADQRVNSDGTYRRLSFTPLYEVTRATYDTTRAVSQDYPQAMGKVGLLPFISERLPEDEYMQPGVYGLKILDTILRGYLD